MATIAQMLVQLGVDTTAFKKGLGQARDELGRFVKMVDQVDRRAATMARATEFADAALTGLTAAAAAFVTTRLAVALKGAVHPALDFGRAMSAVATLVDDQSGLERATASVERLSAAFGHGPVEQARTLYQILASGAGTAAQATNILTQANRLAEGSVTKLDDAANLITTVLRAYGEEAGSAAHVSEQLFTAMKSGHIALDRLAQGLDTVAPLAATAGVSLDELLAGLATLRAGGTNTAHALDGLRALLESILDPTSTALKQAKQLGIDWSAAGLQAKGLAGFLLELQARTGGSADALGKLAGRGRNLAPFMALVAGKTEDLVRVLNDLGNSGGNLDRALATMLQDVDHQLEQIAGKAHVVVLELGQRLLRAVAPVIKAINEHFLTLVGVATAVAKALGLVVAGFVAFKAVLLAVKLGELVVAFLSLIPAINGVAGAMAILELATETALAAFGPIGIAIAGVGALAAIIFHLNKQQREAKERASDWAAAMATLNDEQVRNIRTMLQKQIAVAKLNQTLAEAEARDQLVASSQSRFEVAPTVDLRKVQEAAKQVRALEDLLKETNKEIAGRDAQAAAQERINKQIAEYRKQILAMLGGTDDAVDAFDEWRKSILQTLDALDALQVRQETVGDVAGGLAHAFDAARVALEQVENRITDQRALTGQIDPQLVELANTIRKRLAAATRDAFQPLIDGAREAIQRAALVAETGANRFVQAQALDDLKARYRAVLDAIAAQGGALRAPLELLQQQKALVDAIHERSKGMFGQIDEAAIDRVVDTLTKGLNRQLEQAALDTLTLSEALDGVAGLADGMLRVADALGGIGDNARLAIAGVVQLADSLRQVGQATTDTGQFDALKALPGIAGAIASGAQILSGVLGLGASADERAMKEAIQQNSKRLRELRDGLDQFQLDATKTLGAGQTARSLLTDRDFLRQLSQANQQTLFLPGALHPENLLDQRLREMGSSFAQLNAVAQSLGITLETTEGDINILALRDLMEAAGLTAESLTRLSQTFDVQQRAAELRARLTGDTSPLATLQQDLQLFQHFAPDLAASFGAIDTATEEGRDRLRAAILHLLNSVEAGTLSPEQLGRLQDADQLLDVLDELTSALDAVPRQLTRFGDTLEQQRAALDLKARLFGQDSPAAAIQRELDLLAQFAPQLGQAFQGLDATTAEGRAAIRTALQHLFTTIEQGLLTEGALGQLEGLEDLLSIISTVTSDLDEFGDATNAATAALRNVPEGFKLALRTFQSSFAELALQATAGPVEVAPPPTVTGPSAPPAFDPGRLPRQQFTFGPGSIVIEGTNLTADEIFDAVSAEARRKALALYGDAERAAEAL